MKICKDRAILLFLLLIIYLDDVGANKKKRKRKAKCKKPRPVKNAELRDEYDNIKKFKEGDKIEYNCELGYTVEGITRERWCRNTKWTKVRFTCNRMSTNVNGDISIDEKLAGNNDYKEYIGDREFTVLELDMIVDKSDKRPSRPERYRAIFDKDEKKRWKINVPFEIGDGIGDLQELKIRRSIPIWEQYSCLHFHDNTQLFHRLVFKLGEDNFCASAVGMKQGPQPIYLGKNCYEPEIIVHEIGHALGFYHEHNRWDRDDYIKIHYENINPGSNKSFIKRKPEIADFDHDYDYLSIMHYGQYFFSKNTSAKRITIETTDPKFQSKIGKVKHPSFQDYKTLNAMYKCKDLCPQVKCPEGGFLGKHCQCYCKGNTEGAPVRLCFQKEECPTPFVNKYLFDVMNKDSTSLINMARTSFPDKTILNLFSTNWNCKLASQLKCEGGKWTKIHAECPVTLDIEMIGETVGVVEVILNDVYRGYICDDDWDDNDATVACKMLGYTKGWAYFQNPQEVNESLPILLDNVQCRGDELSLADCKHNGWGNHDCEYSEVVTVKCFDDSYTNHIDKTHCGKIKINDSKRKKRQLKVTGGFETIQGMHPWQVEIQRRKKRRWTHWCGGTIINNEWILSAAHCFDDLKGKYDSLNAKLYLKDVHVIVGDHDLNKYDEYEEMFQIEYIVKHWNYSEFEKKYSHNDIALLKIKSTSGISFNDYIQPACLPEEFTQLSSKTKCKVLGWGKESELGTITDTLRAAEVMIIPEKDCHRYYNKYPINFKKVICAGDGSADTCQGDSGGPLICEINGQSTVIGITSWGKGCSQHDAPGVYTNVSEYVRWINSQISNRRLKKETRNVEYNRGVDIFLLVDISKSITLEQRNTTFNFLFTLLPELGINDGDTGTRLALTFFGTKPLRMFDQHLTASGETFKSHEEAVEEIRTYLNKFEEEEHRWILWHTNYGSAITAALNDVYNQIETKLVLSRNGKGRNSKQVLIIISDGRFTSMGDPTNAASKLKNDFDVEIYSFAIGNKTYTLSFYTMSDLASQIENEQHFFQISNDESVLNVDLSSLSTQIKSDHSDAASRLKKTDTIGYYTMSDLASQIENEQYFFQISNARLSPGKSGLDVVLLVDVSSSIGDRSFHLAKKFMKLLVNLFGVSKEESGGTDGTRFALITFSDRPDVVFNLNDRTARSKTEVKKQIDNIQNSGGGTNLMTALHTVIREIHFPVIMKDRRRMSDGTRAIFLLTDAEETSNVRKDRIRTVANTLKTVGNFEIFCIGIGKGKDYNTLTEIASTPRHVFSLSKIKDLEKIGQSITGKNIDYGQCGVSENIVKLSRSERAEEGAWPWLGWLSVLDDEDIPHTCGGAVVCDRWFLTTASCVSRKIGGQVVPYKTSRINVFLSDYDILKEDTNEIWPVVHDVIIHDNYIGEEIENLGIYANDVALLDFGQKESERPVFNKYLRPICVATAKDSLKAAKTYFRISQSFSSYINTFTAGWGNAPDNIHHTSLLHSKMMQNQRSVVKPKYCKRRYENIDLDRFFCVGEEFEESDSCMGDVGGPFMVQMHDKRFFSLGLALKTRDCKQKNNYSIFLNLLHPTVSEWINRVLDGCNKFESKDD